MQWKPFKKSNQPTNQKIKYKLSKPTKHSKIRPSVNKNFQNLIELNFSKSQGKSSWVKETNQPKQNKATKTKPTNQNQNQQIQTV